MSSMQEMWGEVALSTPWVLATLVFAVAVGVGFAWVRRSADSRPSASAGVDSEALEEKKRSLLRQLEELELERGRIAEEVYAEEHDRLVGAAAGVLRELDHPEVTVPSVTQTVTDVAPATRQSRLGWLVAGVLFCVVLVMVAKNDAKDRVGDQPMSGGDSIAMKTEFADTDLDALDIPALNALTHKALQERNFDVAMRTVERVRTRAPQDPEMLTHLATLQASVGMMDRALATVDQALAASKDFEEALIMRGLLLLGSDRPEEGVEALEYAKGVVTSPADAAMIDQVLARAKLGVPAVGGEALAAPEEAEAPAKIRGTVRRALGEPFGRGTLFLIVRPSPVAAGPPTASQKLTPEGVSVQFALSESDIMLGGGWPDQVWLTARLDADGDPLTKSADDWTSEVLGPFAPGTEGIEVVLQPQGASVGQ